MGIPTLTITTTSFAGLIMDILKEQGVPKIAMVVVEHPIAGHSTEGIRKKMDGVFPEIMKIAVKWNPE
jgi:hypothetical protein